MKLYQLVAEGPLAYFNRGHHYYSKHVFTSLDDAEKHKPIFAQSCINETGDKYLDLFRLEKVTEVKIVELELAET